MTGLNHVLTGTAIALAVKQPLLVAPLAFLSHFVLDSTPHYGGSPAYQYGHRHFAKIMIADGALACAALILTAYFAPVLTLAVLVGAFFAILPDVFWPYYYMNGRPKHWFFTFHQKIQWFERPPGAIVEASYFIFISTVIFALIWRS